MAKHLGGSVRFGDRFGEQGTGRGSQGKTRYVSSAYARPSPDRALS